MKKEKGKGSCQLGSLTLTDCTFKAGHIKLSAAIYANIHSDVNVSHTHRVYFARPPSFVCKGVLAIYSFCHFTRVVLRVLEPSKMHQNYHFEPKLKYIIKKIKMFVYYLQILNLAKFFLKNSIFVHI